MVAPFDLRIARFCLPLTLAALVLVCRPAVAAEEAVPLERIVLFNSGVGFFERSGEVEGNAELELKFNADEVNDLLKSLVVEDRGGGRVATVTYGSRDPITRTLGTFAIDLNNNPTLADLLAQVRGERVEVEVADDAATVQGTMVGISTRKKQVGEEVIEQQCITLLASDGLRTFELDALRRIRLLNEELNDELEQALAVLALGHDVDEKTVKVRFTGEGRRPVRLGYIQQTPLWKTSYRLVLREGDESPLLQGWAIVENTSDSDWPSVRLTLVSGRPISFAMDLYEPLYISRPLVEPDVFASLRPQVYGQDLSQDHLERLVELNLGRASGLQRDAAAEELAASQLGVVSGRYGEDRVTDYDHLNAQNLADYGGVAGAFGGAGMASAAQASELGELFQYEIELPVTLPRQQSAMLPIVNDSVQVERVSIYNEAVHGKHPLNGLRLTNTTALHLMAGPITVFDAGAYAGDARIEDLPAGGERLVSYAMDLDTEVAFRDEPFPQELLSMTVVRGVAQFSHKYRQSRDYTIKNSGDRPRRVLIEYPRQDGWELITPKEPGEVSRNTYRFDVTAPPGDVVKLTVAREQVLRTETSIADWGLDEIAVYLRSRVISQAVKDKLAEVVRMQQELAALGRDSQQREGRIKTIENEQDRIRQNMEQLDRNSDLYRSYVEKFTQQEVEIGELRDEIARLQDQLNTRRAELALFMQDLSVE